MSTGNELSDLVGQVDALREEQQWLDLVTRQTQQEIAELKKDLASGKTKELRELIESTTKLFNDELKQSMDKISKEIAAASNLTKKKEKVVTTDIEKLENEMRKQLSVITSKLDKTTEEISLDIQEAQKIVAKKVEVTSEEITQLKTLAEQLFADTNERLETLEKQTEQEIKETEADIKQLKEDYATLVKLISPNLVATKTLVEQLKPLLDDKVKWEDKGSELAIALYFSQNPTQFSQQMIKQYQAIYKKVQDEFFNVPLDQDVGKDVLRNILVLATSIATLKLLLNYFTSKEASPMNTGELLAYAQEIKEVVDNDVLKSFSTEAKKITKSDAQETLIEYDLNGLDLTTLTPLKKLNAYVQDMYDNALALEDSINGNDPSQALVTYRNNVNEIRTLRYFAK